MAYLKQVKYLLPNSDQDFSKSFLSFLSSAGSILGNQLSLTLPQLDFLPETVFEFTETKIPKVVFLSDNGEYEIEVKNSTGEEKQSPHSYKLLGIDEFTERLGGIKLLSVDHTGFNLPWFDGVHPELLRMRDLLKDKCLYHLYPKELANEPWDFILLGTQDEIDGREKVDYQKNRNPKIEIVSFEKSSTPIIQIDLQLTAKYEELLELLPEAINDKSLRNLWLYLKNDFGIDVCFVLNEVSKGNWIHYFENSRLI